MLVSGKNYMFFVYCRETRIFDIIAHVWIAFRDYVSIRKRLVEFLKRGVHIFANSNINYYINDITLFKTVPTHKSFSFYSFLYDLYYY